MIEVTVEMYFPIKEGDICPKKCSLKKDPDIFEAFCLFNYENCQLDQSYNPESFLLSIENQIH